MVINVNNLNADKQPDEPIPLIRTNQLPPFPVDALPSTFSQMVSELAHATQTDPAMAGASSLSVLSAAVGGHAEIEVRPGWREPLCTYIAEVAQPGERKSAVQAAMTAPLRVAEAELSLVGEIERLEQQEQLELAKKTADRLRTAAANAASAAAKPNATKQDRQAAKDAQQEALKAAAAVREIAVPVIPRLLADDITPEATASLLAEHNGRMAIISAEGGIFDIIAGRYSRTVNLDIYLKGHSGDPVRVDRQGRPPQYIPRPALTVGVMVQKRVLETIAANRDFTGRGLLARFLYARPVSKVGRRQCGSKPVDEDTAKKYGNFIRNLASEMAGWAGDPAVLMLTPEAEAEVLRIEEEVEPTLADDAELASPPTLTEWGSKYVGAVVRIAGLLHFAEHGDMGSRRSVQPATILAAEQLGNYFKAAAMMTLNEMGMDRDVADAMYLLDRIEHLGRPKEVSERELFTACSRPRFPTMDAMVPALARLVDHGYLIPQEAPKPTGGRPASPRYRVHPASAEAAKAAKGWL